jgi:uncharacterized protein (TIGR02599 family)
MKRLHLFRPHAGFTLTEVLVSSALIVGIMALMLTTVDQTRRTISNTTSRVAQFQNARVAFEAMTRTLGQATLNTYYDLDRNGDVNQNPLGYRRQSDLHFVCGQAHQTKLLGASGGGATGPRDAAHFPGHAVFFQAPLGVTAQEKGAVNSERVYRGLTNLLSVVGYYVKWGDDEERPLFMGDTEKHVPQRFRYRLMQVQQPAETVMVYADINYTELTAGGAGKPKLKASPGLGFSGPTDWIHVAVGTKNFPNAFKEVNGARSMDYSRVLAENIVGLIIVPKVPEKDRKSPDRLDDLTDDFEYDTCPEPAFLSQKREFSSSPADLKLMNMKQFLNAKALKQLHQLPPILQVTMIAIDEESGAKLAGHSEQPPDWLTGRFARLSTTQQFLDELGDPVAPSRDSVIYKIGNSDRAFSAPPMKYRVFTTDVVLRGAKWSN